MKNFKYIYKGNINISPKNKMLLEMREKKCIRNCVYGNV